METNPTSSVNERGARALAPRITFIASLRTSIRIDVLISFLFFSCVAFRMCSHVCASSRSSNGLNGLGESERGVVGSSKFGSFDERLHGQKRISNAN